MRQKTQMSTTIALALLVIVGVLVIVAVAGWLFGS
jgi:hypothetical protein